MYFYIFTGCESCDKDFNIFMQTSQQKNKLACGKDFDTFTQKHRAENFKGYLLEFDTFN